MLFGARYWGSEVCDGSALAFRYRNSGSSRWNSYWYIVVMQEIGDKPNVPSRVNAFLKRDIVVQRYVMFRARLLL